ncbi:MAG: hypothetical protein WA120_04185 [Candidatus Hydromicrobium sp.]
MEKIFATIRVSGTKAEDIWEFTWINVNTGEIIADSTGRYLEEGSGYIEGYLSNYIVPAQEEGIIGEPGNYRVEVFHNGLLEGEYCFKVVEKEVPDATFSPENIYKNEKYKFSICFPDDWNCGEDESNEGLEVDFIPGYDNINVIIHMRVLKEGYFPSEENYSDFSDQLLNDLVASNDTPEVEKSESTGEIGDVIYRQINYHYPGEDKDGWDVDLIFINRNNMLYLLIKVSDIYYKRFADKVYKNMLDSLSFD